MSKPRYCWDSVAFLSFLKQDANHQSCRQVLDLAERGQVEIAASALALCEVVHIKGRIRMDDQDERLIQGLFEKSYIILVDVDRRVAEFSRQLLWKHPTLQPKDSVHVAGAIIAKADELHTFDDGLLRLTGQIENLKICNPGVPQPGLY